MKTIQNTSLLFLVLATVSGCAVPPNSQDFQFTSAQRIIEKPKLIEPKHTGISDYHLHFGNDAPLERAFNKYLQTGKAPNIITDGFVKFAFSTLQQPIIKTTPLQETVISLENGEKFTNVTSGDPSRWSYAVAVSGSGKNEQQHILVKPSLPDLSTNLVITTDKRIYNLRLISCDNAQVSRSVSFWYPEDLVKSINHETIENSEKASVSIAPQVNLHELNFNYSISAPWFSPDLAWKPTRVFDDLTHTYIQFPEHVSSHDLPVLFILNGNKQELVNYRYKQPYFIVDKVFKQAILMMGAGASQQKITITNNSYH